MLVLEYWLRVKSDSKNAGENLAYTELCGDLTTRGKNVCCTREILKSACIIENRNGGLLVNCHIADLT